MTSTASTPSADVAGWLGRRAEDVLSALLVAMFGAFMLQIVTRYVLNAPLSWTAELSTICWVWGILWGAALVLRDEEEIRFLPVEGAPESGERREGRPRGPRGRDPKRMRDGGFGKGGPHDGGSGKGGPHDGGSGKGGFKGNRRRERG